VLLAPGAHVVSKLEGRGLAQEFGGAVFEELLPRGTDPLDAARLAGQKPHNLLGPWCRAALARATQRPGFGHLLGLPQAERLAVAMVLLHAATCHYYATAEAAAGDGRDAGCGGGGRCTAWPYSEACCEPLFASLRPQHQWWLISDVLAALWAPGALDADG
jgi:hypothetical protein